MLNHTIISSIICSEYMHSYSKWQKKNDEPSAMLVSFSLSIDYDIEEGYRNLEIAVYAPMNYVGVYLRETWDVIRQDDLEILEDGEAQIKESSEGYIKGASDWHCAGYHDSCWRDAVENILRAYAKRISILNTFDHWHTKKAVELIELPDESNDERKWNNSKVLGFQFEKKKS